MRLFLITFLLTVLSALLFQQSEVGSSRTKQAHQTQLTSGELEPTVKLQLLNVVNGVTWGSQIRYSIDVNDEVDGASKYNEINPQEVFLEIQFSPNNDSLKFQEDMNDSLSLKGLRLLGILYCFGCHADKETMIGPSFSEISNEYPNDESTIDKLVNSIRQGSVGEWGDAEMPSNPGISEEDALAIAEYILKQGANEYGWVYPGLEGVFRVMDQPQRFEQGKYVFTASYTSSLKLRGVDTKVISIE